MKRFKTLFVAAVVACGIGVVAAPAIAGNNAQDSLAYQHAVQVCQAGFPNTCFGVTKLSEGVCLGSPSNYCNYYYRFYGYYGSRKVRCDTTIQVTTPAKTATHNYLDCWYA